MSNQTIALHLGVGMFIFGAFTSIGFGMAIDYANDPEFADVMRTLANFFLLVAICGVTVLLVSLIFNLDPENKPKKYSRAAI